MRMGNAGIKVFLCHAYEDRDFVTRLHRSLQLAGIDAWFDKVEIRPGDSLSQKIFTEGLPGCSHAAIIYSHFSTIEGGWVRRERDAIAQLRDSGHIRLIPIVIDKDVDNDLLREAAGTSYIPFLDWQRKEIFPIYFQDVVRAVGLGGADDLSRFESPSAFRSYWQPRELTRLEAKNELFTIFEVPRVSQKEEWNDWERTNITRFLSKKLNYDVDGRLAVIDYAISNMPTRYALQEEKGLALLAKWKATNERTVWEDACKVLVQVWGKSKGKSWKSGMYLFDLYDADGDNEKALEWFERLGAHQLVKPTDRVLLAVRAARLYMGHGKHESARAACEEWLSVIEQIDAYIEKNKIDTFTIRSLCSHMAETEETLETLGFLNEERWCKAIEHLKTIYCERPMNQ